MDSVGIGLWRRFWSRFGLDLIWVELDWIRFGIALVRFGLDLISVGGILIGLGVGSVRNGLGLAWYGFEFYWWHCDHIRFDCVWIGSVVCFRSVCCYFVGKALDMNWVGFD